MNSLLPIRGVHCYEACLIYLINRECRGWPVIMKDYFRLFTSFDEIKKSNTRITGNARDLLGICYRPEHMGAQTAWSILQKNRFQPTMIAVNSFYCEWRAEYYKHNREHHLIALSMEQERLFCLDPLFSAKLQVISRQNFIKSFDKLYSQKTQIKKAIDYSSLFHSSVRDMMDGNLLEQYKELIQQLINEDLRIPNFTATNQFWESNDIQKWIYLLSGARKLYCQFLQWLVENNVIEAYKVFHTMKTIEEKWDAFNNQILKYSILQTEFNSSAFLKMLLDIVRLEFQWIQSLRSR